MKQYIYKITVLTTNKSYIGITNNPGRRLGQHMRILLSYKINEWYIPRNHNKDKRSFKLLNKNFINK